MCSILKVFCLGRWWTPRDGLYGIADQSIDPGLGLHGPIGIPELSTFDLKVCMIRIVYNIYSFSVTRRHKLLHVLANYSSGFWGEAIFVSPQRCGDVLMFCSGRGSTPRDGLYGIADRLIDPDLGLHGPIGIPELSTLNPKKIVCRLK
jgi:hypothetical protein